MFLAKNSIPLQPKLLLGAKDLLKDLRPAARWKSDEKKCFKYRPSKVKGQQECIPVPVHKPKYYKQLDPCKTDRQLAVQHPKYLGVYGRCHIPYKPEFDCIDPCDLAERMDDTMYRPSASLDRKFDKYWVECYFRKSKRCCRKVPPERSYRVESKKCGPKAKKRMCPPTVNPMPCRQEAKAGACPRFQLCDCPPLAHTQVNCRLAPRIVRCRRRPCQYPSFSECKHEELGVGRPIECRCLEVPATCAVYRIEALGRRGACAKVDQGFDKCDE